MADDTSQLKTAQDEAVQSLWDQNRNAYTAGRLGQIASAVGIPTSSDDAMAMAAGPRASIAAWLLNAQNKAITQPAGEPAPVVTGPQTVPDEPTVANGGRNPFVPGEGPNGTIPDIGARSSVPDPGILMGVDEPITPQMRSILESKVPGNYAPLIADDPPPLANPYAMDAWRKRNGYPTQDELQQKIAAFSAQESGQLQPMGAEPPVRTRGNYPGYVSPGGAVQESLYKSPYTSYESPLAKQILSRPDYDPNAVYTPDGLTMQQAADELEDAHRAGKAVVGQPGMGNYPPEPPRKAAAEPNVGKPGKSVTAEEAERLLSGPNPEAAFAEHMAAAAVPRATRIKNTLRAAAADFAGPAMDLAAAGLAAGAMAKLSNEETKTGRGSIEWKSYQLGLGPLNYAQVGPQDRAWLKMHPDEAEELRSRGAIAPDAFRQIMAEEGDMEPMRRAMQHLGG